MAGAGWCPAGSARSKPEMLDRDVVPVRHEQQPEALGHGDATMPATMAAEQSHTAVRDRHSADPGDQRGRPYRRAVGAKDMSIHHKVKFLTLAGVRPKGPTPTWG